MSISLSNMALMLPPISPPPSPTRAQASIEPEAISPRSPRTSSRPTVTVPRYQFARRSDGVRSSCLDNEPKLQTIHEYLQLDLHKGDDSFVFDLSSDEESVAGDEITGDIGISIGGMAASSANLGLANLADMMKAHQTSFTSSSEGDEHELNEKSYQSEDLLDSSMLVHHSDGEMEDLDNYEAEDDTLSLASTQISDGDVSSLHSQAENDIPTIQVTEATPRNSTSMMGYSREGAISRASLLRPSLSRSSTGSDCSTSSAEIVRLLAANRLSEVPSRHRLAPPVIYAKSSGSLRKTASMDEERFYTPREGVTPVASMVKLGGGVEFREQAAVPEPSKYERDVLRPQQRSSLVVGGVVLGDVSNGVIGRLRQTSAESSKSSIKSSSTSGGVSVASGSDKVKIKWASNVQLPPSPESQKASSVVLKTPESSKYSVLVAATPESNKSSLLSVTTPSSRNVSGFLTVDNNQSIRSLLSTKSTPELRNIVKVEGRRHTFMFNDNGSKFQEDLEGASTIDLASLEGITGIKADIAYAMKAESGEKKLKRKGKREHLKGFFQKGVSKITKPLRRKKSMRDLKAAL